MKKVLQGTIISDKMQDTAVVRVDTVKEHPKYRKRFKFSKKYKAHNEGGKFKLGEKVIIEESKPISKDKRWVVKGLIGK